MGITIISYIRRVIDIKTLRHVMHEARLEDPRIIWDLPSKGKDSWQLVISWREGLILIIYTHTTLN